MCKRISGEVELKDVLTIHLYLRDLGEWSSSTIISFPEVCELMLIELTTNYEFALAGTYLTQLEALDPDEGVNAEITYRLETTPQSTWFDINENSGLITTA